MEYSLNKYIGIPFKVKGRDFNGVDCWGLVYLWYKHELGIELQRYDDLYSDLTKDKDKISKHIESEKEILFNKVESYQPGDIFLFRIKGVEFHVGVYFGNNFFLHAIKNANSCMERLNNNQGRNWNPKLVGAYRYE